MAHNLGLKQRVRDKRERERERERERGRERESMRAQVSQRSDLARSTPVRPGRTHKLIPVPKFWQVHQITDAGFTCESLGMGACISTQKRLARVGSYASVHPPVIGARLSLILRNISSSDGLPGWATTHVAALVASKTNTVRSSMSSHE